MGANNSKENSDLTLSANDNNNTRRLSLKNKSIIYHGWQEICRCSHTDWLKEISGMNFFSTKTFY